MGDRDESDAESAPRRRLQIADRLVAHGHHRDASRAKQPGVVATLVAWVSPSRRDALACDPPRVPAQRRDRGRRIETPGRPATVRAQDVATARPDPWEPERRPRVKRRAPHVDASIAVEVLRDPLCDTEEVVPGPVIARIGDPGPVEEIPIVHNHERRVAPGKRVDRVTTTEDPEHRRLVASEVDAYARQVG